MKKFSVFLEIKKLKIYFNLLFRYERDMNS